MAPPPWPRPRTAELFNPAAKIRACPLSGGTSGQRLPWPPEGEVCLRTLPRSSEFGGATSAHLRLLIRGLGGFRLDTFHSRSGPGPEGPGTGSGTVVPFLAT